MAVTFKAGVRKWEREEVDLLSRLQLQAALTHILQVSSSSSSNSGSGSGRISAAAIVARQQQW